MEYVVSMWRSVLKKLFFTHKNKDLSILEPYDIVKVINVYVESVYCVLEYALVIL